ncbi:hypothetical protein ACJ72_08387, partial [Emergomyces africanus]
SSTGRKRGRPRQDASKALSALQEQLLNLNAEEFRPFRNFKAYTAKQRGPETVAGIRVPNTYEEAISGPQSKE